jgi:predicted RNase H-like HicB family nuclease
MNFQVVFTFDPDYRGYVADVPALPGCMSQGKTMDEAKSNIRDAIAGYLEVLRKHGTPYHPSPNPPVVSEITV